MEEVGEIHIIKREENSSDQQQKTGERIIYTSMALIFEIDEYVTNQRPYIKESNKIFVSNRGKTKGCPISRSALEKVFKICSEKTGIKCTPHMLRHTHLTELKEAGYDIYFIKERAGHSSLNSTSLYIDPSEKAKRDIFERYLHNVKEGANGN